MIRSPFWAVAVSMQPAENNKNMRYRIFIPAQRQRLADKQRKHSRCCTRLARYCSVSRFTVSISFFARRSAVNVEPSHICSKQGQPRIRITRVVQTRDENDTTLHHRTHPLCYRTETGILSHWKHNFISCCHRSKHLSRGWLQARSAIQWYSDRSIQDTSSSLLTNWSVVNISTERKW